MERSRLAVLLMCLLALSWCTTRSTANPLLEIQEASEEAEYNDDDDMARDEAVDIARDTDSETALISVAAKKAALATKHSVHQSVVAELEVDADEEAEGCKKKKKKCKGKKKKKKCKKKKKKCKKKKKKKKKKKGKCGKKKKKCKGKKKKKKKKGKCGKKKKKKCKGKKKKKKKKGKCGKGKKGKKKKGKCGKKKKKKKKKKGGCCCKKPAKCLKKGKKTCKAKKCAKKAKKKKKKKKCCCGKPTKCLKKKKKMCKPKKCAKKAKKKKKKKCCCKSPTKCAKKKKVQCPPKKCKKKKKKKCCCKKASKCAKKKKRQCHALKCARKKKKRCNKVKSAKKCCKKKKQKCCNQCPKLPKVVNGDQCNMQMAARTCCTSEMQQCCQQCPKKKGGNQYFAPQYFTINPQSPQFREILQTGLSKCVKKAKVKCCSHKKEECCTRCPKSANYYGKMGGCDYKKVAKVCCVHPTQTCCTRCIKAGMPYWARVKAGPPPCDERKRKVTCCQHTFQTCCRHDCVEGKIPPGVKATYPISAISMKDRQPCPKGTTAQCCAAGQKSCCKKCKTPPGSIPLKSCKSSSKSDACKARMKEIIARQRADPPLQSLTETAELMPDNDRDLPGEYLSAIQKWHAFDNKCKKLKRQGKECGQSPVFLELHLDEPCDLVYDKTFQRCEHDLCDLLRDKCEILGESQLEAEWQRQQASLQSK